MNAYGQDLAYVHDVGFSDFAAKSAPGLLGILRRSGIRDGRVIDLGCGSGIWAKALLGAGYRVLGVDISPSMIALARRKAPGAVFRQGSLFRTPLPPAVAVTSLGECLNYTFEAFQSTPYAMNKLFSRVHHALRPGGLFISDVRRPPRAPFVRQRYFEGEDWVVLVDTRADRRRLTRRITTYRRVGTLYRRSEETHRLQILRPRALAAELRRTGFTVRFSRRYGSFELPAQVGFVARKKKAT